MRLLERDDAGQIRLAKYFNKDIPPYAILSHTWRGDDDEVAFADMNNSTGECKLGYDKIRFCAEQAARDGFRYFWVDTCCIDKSNRHELSETIHLMFRWYKAAAVCYVFLSDVPPLIAMPSSAEDRVDELLLQFRSSRWFTRGWTLQELLAPSDVQFFAKDSTVVGNKETLENPISEATGIPTEALRGSPLQSFTTEERLR